MLILFIISVLSLYESDYSEIFRTIIDESAKIDKSNGNIEKSTKKYILNIIDALDESYIYQNPNLSQYCQIFGYCIHKPVLYFYLSLKCILEERFSLTTENRLVLSHENFKKKLNNIIVTLMIKTNEDVFLDLIRNVEDSFYLVTY